MIELLAPAGDLAKLKTAIRYGADAVFIGGEQFSLRAMASNFTLDDIKQAVEFVHAHHKLIYVTVNVYPHEEELSGLDEYLLALDELKVDAIIVSSFYIISRARELGCKFELHLSTQQSVANELALLWFKSLGIARVVLARECNLAEIKTMSKVMPVEVFIHGGMCSAISGRCTLSNNFTGRDANRGGCAHSCRWSYRLYQGEEELNDFLIGSKDLMSVDVIEELKNTKIASMKIEGRMKSHNYIASLVSAYALLLKCDKINSEVIARAKELIKKAENRPTTLGYFDENIGAKDLIYDLEEKRANQDFIGIVDTWQDHRATFMRMNYLKLGDCLEVLFFDGTTRDFIVEEIIDGEGNNLEVANKSEQVISINLPFIVPQGVILRKK